MLRAVMPSVGSTDYHYAEFQYAKSRHGGVIRLSVVMLSAVKLNVFILTQRLDCRIMIGVFYHCPDEALLY